MRKAIKNYFKKLQKYPDYYKHEDFHEISKEIKNGFRSGIIPLERGTKTNVSLFDKEFGYHLPDEIADYINMFWHPCISGYVYTSECIVLFSVLKKEGDSDDDILFYRNSLISMVREWAESGDIQRYIPIGWLGYSGCYVLYEAETGKIFLEDRDVEGKVEDKPIADSLKNLIMKMDIKT